MKKVGVNGREICAKKRFLSGVLVLCVFCALFACGQSTSEAQTSSTFAMDTLVTQTAYGDNAQEAMQEVNRMLAEEESRLSLFVPDSEIAAVNMGATGEAVPVSPDTAELVQAALEISQETEGAFALSIAPLSLAWGIAGENPRVPEEEELVELLRLVDDAAVHVEQNSILLEQEGMGLDLGGLAKGAACIKAADIYAEYGVDSALLYLGGNIYARGTKPDASPWRIGFRDPEGGQDSYIASFSLQDAVASVSGGYERYFEEDGKRYIHILDPRTGYPVESDLLSVGVIHEDGMVADIWSTSLFVQGVDATIAYMQAGGQAIALDREGNLYVSAALEEGFSLQTPQSHSLQFVEVIP